MTDFATTRLGDRVAYDLRGSGPALIFVAAAVPYRAIDPVTTRTAERAAELGLTTLVADRLGRGESPAEGRIDLERELAAIEALIDVVGGAAVLCGSSSGCSIALRAAASGLPVTGLALWEPPFDGAEGGTREWIAEFERLLDAGRLEAALAQYMKDMPPEWLEGLRRSPIYPQVVAQAASLRADGESLVWADSAPHRQLFAGIRVPTLVLLGQETFPGMFDAADSLVDAIPGAVQKQVPGADHSWEPEAMATELFAFVTGAHEPARPATVSEAAR